MSVTGLDNHRGQPSTVRDALRLRTADEYLTHRPLLEGEWKLHRVLVRAAELEMLEHLMGECLSQRSDLEPIRWPKVRRLPPPPSPVIRRWDVQLEAAA